MGRDVGNGKIEGSRGREGEGRKVKGEGRGRHVGEMDDEEEGPLAADGERKTWRQRKGKQRTQTQWGYYLCM